MTASALVVSGDEAIELGRNPAPPPWVTVIGLLRTLAGLTVGVARPPPRAVVPRVHDPCLWRVLRDDR